ncbi:hypothetical protein BJX64DRAFT_283333 [Aspergillus heterothallicus]
MPANSLPDPSMMFLYLCMIHSDLTKIDFNAVGDAVGLKHTAARMRYTRLKKAIESGIVDGKVNLKPTDGVSGPVAAAAATSGATGDSTEDDEEMVSAPALASTSPQKKKSATKPRVKVERGSSKGVQKSPRKKGTAKGKGMSIKQENDDENYGLERVDEEMGDAAP